MSKSLAPRANTLRFFSAFQRYVSLTSASHPHFHTHTPPLRTLQRVHPAHSLPTPRHATTSTTPTPSSPPPQTPPATPIFYNLFPASLPRGPPPSGPFTLDPKALRAEFLSLQARAHPDRHPGASKARAEGTSALINTAYRTLRSPLLRAQYLLSLRGIDVAEDEGLKVEDPELLGEVLEAREEIEAAGEEGELEWMRVSNGHRIAESEGVLERCFGEDDLEGAKGEAVRLRYWVNIKESLDAWEKGKPVVLVH